MLRRKSDALGRTPRPGRESRTHTEVKLLTNPLLHRSLLITLDILKTLCAECRQEISLFGRYVVASVDHAMSALSSDLQVVARSASAVSCTDFIPLDLTHSVPI
jgi:hypothetical protein